MFLYLITAEPDFVKVGIAADPKRRVSLMQSGSPLRLDLRFYCPADHDQAKQVERSVLSIMKRRGKALHGEWMRAPYDEVREVLGEVMEGRFHLVAQEPKSPLPSGDRAGLCRAYERLRALRSKATKRRMPPEYAGEMQMRYELLIATPKERRTLGLD